MPAPKTPYDAAMASALGLLRVRGRSRSEIARALQRRGYDETIVLQVLTRLGELGYLDDAELALARASAWMRARLGPESIRRRLEALGLDEAAVDRALSQAAEAQGFNPEAAAREVLVKRRLDPAALGPRDRARAARLLASRGFDEDVIGNVLGRADVDPPEEGG